MFCFCPWVSRGIVVHISREWVEVSVGCYMAPCPPSRSRLLNVPILPSFFSESTSNVCLCTVQPSHFGSRCLSQQGPRGVFPDPVTRVRLGPLPPMPAPSFPWLPGSASSLAPSPRYLTSPDLPTLKQPQVGRTTAYWLNRLG